MVEAIVNAARRSSLFVTVLVAGAVGAAPTALATSPYSLKASPSPAGVRQAITLTLRAPVPRAGTHYEVLFQTRTTGPACSSGPGRYVRLRRSTSGVFRLTVRPATGVWCGEVAGARVRRVTRRGAHSRTLAAMTVRIDVPRPSELPPLTMLTVLLPGSTLTARSPGRPDRTTPLTGQPLRGVKTSILSWPVTIERLTGTLGLPSFAPDSMLCPGSTPPAGLTVLPASRLEMAARQDLLLVLDGSPAHIFGCGAAGSSAGTTTIRLSGKAVPDPRTGSIIDSTDITLTGRVTGIRLPGGATGELSVDLVATEDLSGRA